MPQDVLTFTKDKKKYVSKPFDFKAMCIINGNHNDDSLKGPLAYSADAVDYMFEGSEATQDVIDSLDVGTRTRLCMQLWNMYIDALSASVKNE